MNKQRKYQYNEYDNLLEGGEGEGEAAADAEAKPEEDADEKKSEKPASEKKSEKPASEKPASEKSDKKRTNTWNPEDTDPYPEPLLEKCCCCQCVCSNKFTEESSCCGCFPIKCGAVTIGIITVFVTTILFVWYFFLFLNEYIHWWYVLVCLFLLCPILVGSSFIISWFTSDTATTRTMLYTSQILALASVFCLCCWNLIYFVFIYKKDKFYAGMGDIPSNVYTQQSKNNFIFTMLGESVFMFCMFGYFLCVTAAYSEDMHGPPEEETPEEEKKDEEDAKSNKSAAKSEKEKPKSAAGEDEGAGDAKPAEGE